MKYVVVAHGGTQYQLSEDQKVSLFHIEGEVGTLGKFENVLLTVNDDKVTVGAPSVKGASVSYKIEKQYQGKKLNVFKYKSKSRYRKTKGHRDALTDIVITKLNFN